MSAIGAEIASKVFNSCGNRNCPKCQATARANWLAEREVDLLPVPYFHVVFTLPQQIGRLALQNQRQIYNILFQAASEPLLSIAAELRSAMACGCEDAPAGFAGTGGAGFSAGADDGRQTESRFSKCWGIETTP